MNQNIEILENREAWQQSYTQGWLQHFKASGEIDWKRYNRPRNKLSPSGSGVDLSQSRLMLVTTSGAYLPESQPPFDAPNPLGDYEVRVIPSPTPLDALAYAHDHYDRSMVDTDPQVLVPLAHLHDMLAEGLIGELAPSFVSFMGYQPDAARVIDETYPAILKVAKEEQVNAALLVPA